MPCRAWTCSHCARQRRKNLIYDAAQGNPTTLLTLTVNPETGHNPDHRAHMLHDAFRKVYHLIHKQLKLAPHKRWRLSQHTRNPKTDQQLERAAKRRVNENWRRIEWFGFLERTKYGEPHVHILLRAPYIPQDWISEQMGRLIGAPIVDIRRVHNTSVAVHYVTKYVGKAPAKFGTLKRYWQSRGWLPRKREKRAISWTRGDYTVRRESWRDVLQRKVVEGWSWWKDNDEIWHFLKPEYADWSVRNRDPPALRASSRARAQAFSA